MITKTNLIWKFIFGSLLCFLLISSPATASDIFYYKVQGHISDVNRNSISLSDGYMTYSSTVKAFDIKGRSMSTYNLKKGDFVELTIQNFDNKIRVDSIKRVPNPENQAQ